jgi:hypothetical protein
MAPFQGPPANPFVPGATPGSNPSANPFTASGAPGSNPFMPPSPLPPTANPPSSLPPTGHPVMPRPQYDMSRMAAREALIRRLVWIAVIVLGTSIGFLVAMRL